MAAFGRTVAALTHESANSLSGILGMVQVMQCQLVERGAGDSFGDELRLLEEEISQLATLLSNFRSLSHPAQLTLVPTDVASLISETVKLVMLKRRTPAFISAMKQVSLNVCKNAIEAMRSGGTLTINLFCESDPVIEIADSGAGIPEALDIFDFFTTTQLTAAAWA